HSIYYASYLNDFEKGLYYNKKAIESYQEDTIYINKKGIRSIRFNIGVDLYNQGHYGEAIPYFKADLVNQNNRLYRMYGYDWLYKSYDGLKQYDSAYFYFKKMTETKDKLDRLSHARDIKRIEKEYDLTKKERELKELSEKNKRLQNQFMGLIPIFGTILVVLAIIYFLYKRYKRKSTKLEEEKSETLQKLDELKNIVIKNHIVLKDKTKVYVSDLMYIKVDDHYLNIFTSDGRNHYVRGKLKQIKEELPPNFIQCHRSYIVNTNFVKQVNSDVLVLMNKERIPLSRTFKGKFK
ncbi:MAG: LytR/AlgR family response regulator transcription factor, partial [Flavobacteriaceae bacterium]